MEGKLVLVCIDRNRADTELCGSPKDADSDLTTVSGHNFSESFLCYSHSLLPEVAHIAFKIESIFILNKDVNFSKINFKYYQ
jgi:hypothetical protein